MEKVRAFISVPVAPPVVRALEELQGQLRRQMPPNVVRWTPTEQTHLTLRFLGNVEVSAVAELQPLLQAVGRNQGPFQVRAEGVGAFPELRRPRVLWVALQGDLTALRALQGAVEQVSRAWGEKDEAREFHPHLTLGRVREEAGRKVLEAGRVLQAVPGAVLGEWQVTEFLLMRSQLSPQGAIHTRLAAFPLTQAG